MHLTEIWLVVVTGQGGGIAAATAIKNKKS